MQVHILDDDRVLGKALSRQLELLSCESAAFTAVEAFLAHDGSPDLLIVDFNLGGTTALHCADAIEQRRPGVPRVLITATLLTPEERERARALGYREVMTKPWHLADLKAMVGRYQPSP